MSSLTAMALVKRRTRRRNKAAGTPLSMTDQPNDLWCADYKGEFMLADRRYCYPLTITDFASRYLIACEALHTTKEAYAFSVFESVFKEFGLPRAIRTDNGVPFASPNALFGLSRLSVWWLRLGVAIERIKPGNPQQNGRHERMHLTLKLETTKPAADNFLEQRGKFIKFAAGATAAWPLTARAQPRAMPVVGILSPEGPRTGNETLRASTRAYANSATSRDVISRSSIDFDLVPRRGPLRKRQTSVIGNIRIWSPDILPPRHLSTSRDFACSKEC
jgi:transposase InsO family protein